VAPPILGRPISHAQVTLSAGECKERATWQPIQAAEGECLDSLSLYPSKTCGKNGHDFLKNYQNIFGAEKSINQREPKQSK
jgi:hypothetical protein